MSKGIKHDIGKLQYDLLDPYALEDMVKVLTFGAIKYDRHNWKNVEKYRYEAAMMRHYEAYRKGELYDPESGVSHLAHALVNLMFLYCFEREKL
tara:strand:- start:983 stop:1264 length:282 start_codon:yes stop_codon:yes gene_type:complete